MNRKCVLSLSCLSLLSLLCLQSATYSADDKATKKEMRLKKKAEEAKKAAEATKAAEDAKKKESAQRAAINKQVATDTDKPEALKPQCIGAKLDHKAVAAFIDLQLDTARKAANLPASPKCADEEFVRRVYLDITGVIPTYDQTKAFLASREPNKRADLIEQLLASPNYARHQADIWDSLIVQKSSDNRRVDFKPLPKWLQTKFEANTPWDQIVTDVIVSNGTMTKNPGVGFYLSNNTVDKMTDEVSKIFLGVQLQCAQCHDHKFNDWKQTDYWAMAQFFMKVEVSNLKGKDAEAGVREVAAVKRGKNNPLPESAKKVPAQFLQDQAPDLSKTDTYRPVLAKWMTSPTNPFFAKAMVNRTWAQFFGRGIVNPVDDMVGQNQPSHPELLRALAADFSANGYDIKHLIRGICNSEAYQRSTKAVAGNEKAKPEQYAKMAVKVLSPEQLFDSLSQVVGFDEKLAAREKGAAQKGQPQGLRDRFVNFFLAGAESTSPIEYEAGIPQALKLMNSRQVGISAQTVKKVVGSARGTEAIEKIYISALSRSPTPAEVEKLTAYISKSGESPEAMSDILWAVVNSSEFTLNR